MHACMHCALTHTKVVFNLKTRMTFTEKETSGHRSRKESERKSEGNHRSLRKMKNNQDKVSKAVVFNLPSVTTL